MPLAFAPFDWPFMAVLSLLGLLICLRDASPRQALYRGYSFGVGYFGLGVYWVYFSIHHFAYAPLPLAILIAAGLVAILAVYPTLLSWLLIRCLPKPVWLRNLIAFPLLWLVFEALRGWLFTGFPWISVGYSQIDTWLAGWAPVLGVLGLSWAVALTAGAAELLIRRESKHWLGLALVGAVWTAGWGLGRIDWTEPRGPVLKVAMIQANIPQDIKWSPKMQLTTLQLYLELTQQHWEADLVIWPETALPVFYDRVRDTYLQRLQHQAQQHQTDVVLGLPVRSQTSEDYFNGILSTHDLDQFYFKKQLVPLGEYVPLKPLSTWILDWIHIPLSDFSPGKTDQPLLQAAGYPFASSICYEDVFQFASRDGLPQAAFLINVSNDTWFGDTIAPAQHLQMARMRALESGRYLLRSTNTGITAVIDDRGKLAKQAPMFQRLVLESEMRPMQGATPYVATRGMLLWGWGILLAGLMLYFRKRTFSR